MQLQNPNYFYVTNGGDLWPHSYYLLNLIHLDQQAAELDMGAKTLSGSPKNQGLQCSARPLGYFSMVQQHVSCSNICQRDNMFNRNQQ